MSVTRINRKLNLVIEIEDENGKPLWAHSQPISRETFDTYFLLIAKTFSAIYKEGLGAVAGPRVALNLLKTIATEMGVMDDVQKGLLNDIERLTSILAPGENGWERVPLHEAKAKKLLSVEDLTEVENALVFFTVGSWMYRKKEKAGGSLEGAIELWGAQLTSSTSTEFMNSLPTWNRPDNFGEVERT